MKNYISTRRTIPSRNYDSSGCEEYDSFDETAESPAEESDDHDVNEIEVCSCVEEPQSHNEESLDVDDLYTVYVGLEEADPVCVKLQDLLRKGKISKDKIFYKYLSDALEIM